MHIEKFKKKHRAEEIKRLQSHGDGLVIISSHHTECNISKPFEGKTFSLSGKDPEYQSLAGAIDKGLFHEGCCHVLSLSRIEMDRLLATLRGDYGEEARQAKIDRLAREGAWQEKDEINLLAG